MKRKCKGVLVMLLLTALMLVGLCGCIDLTISGIGQEPVSGGVTDKTDPKAPKEIDSDEIAQFYAELTLLGEWSPGRDTVQYVFRIEKDEAGVLTAYEDMAQLSAPADEALLSGLQELIQKYALAEQNGVHRVTAGLPPEYQAARFEAVYTSGESIGFTVNNAPEEPWRQALYLFFADWFAAQGEDALLPETYAGQAERIRVCLIEDGVMTEYGDINVQEQNAIDGERYLFMKDVYDLAADQAVSSEYALFPEDFYDKVSEILAGQDLRPFSYWSALYGYGRENPDDEPEPYTAEVQIYVEYEDGNLLNIETNDPGDKELLQPLIGELRAYFDTLFE